LRVSRNFPSWLNEYVALLSYTEAPRLNHFWAGVGAIAGALRRHVWVDHETFRWYPSFYIIFVAPPEVISKSVTAGVGMGMLREIPGIKFGADSITWQSLVTEFAGAAEQFEYKDEWLPQSALTFFSSELGLLVDFNNKDMMNLLIDLFDGRAEFKKSTKMSGKDSVEAPFMNILACTTPDWIATSIPAIAVGGGFTSRCIFVYADKKERLVAHPSRHVPKDFRQRRTALLQDLEHIATQMVGPYQFTDEAIDWEEAWYKNLWEVEKVAATDYEAKGLQRRHTHLNKLSMILAASRKDELLIEKEDMELADAMLRATATSYPMVFSQIGKTETAVHAERLIDFVRRKGEVEYAEAYKNLHQFFPDLRDMEGIVGGCVRAGLLTLVTGPNGFVLKAKI